MAFVKKDTNEIVDLERKDLTDKKVNEDSNPQDKPREITMDDLAYEIVYLKQRVSELEATNQRVRGAY